MVIFTFIKLLYATLVKIFNFNLFNPYFYRL